MIDAKALATMKQSAFLINVSRAELVDEDALADALARGRIAGAGIDVFSAEPIGPENPLLKVESDRLLLSPHVAGVSQEAAGGSSRWLPRTSPGRSRGNCPSPRSTPSEGGCKGRDRIRCRLLFH